MTTVLRTILLINAMNLRSLPSRLGTSMVVVVGIAGVVTVLVSLLAMARGFETTLRETGKHDRALVLRTGSNSEINGNMPIEQYPIVSHVEGVKKADGNPLASMETFVTAKLPDKDGSDLYSVPMRGVGERSFAVRPELEVVEGRILEAGKFELMAGRNVSQKIRGLDVGDTIKIRGIDWAVVGRFTTDGSAYESELWADERLIAELNGRGNTFSSMLVQLESPADFDHFEAQLKQDPRLTADAYRERDYYGNQSESTTQLIKSVGILIGTIMSIGAVFAAFNTMYAAVSVRKIEIAMLKAMGFSKLPIASSVLVECTLLALIGGTVGGLITYFVFNGYTASTVGGTYTQVSFSFLVTQDILLTGIVLAVALGLIGGSVPAFSALKVPIVEGLKES